MLLIFNMTGVKCHISRYNPRMTTPSRHQLFILVWLWNLVLLAHSLIECMQFMYDSRKLYTHQSSY